MKNVNNSFKKSVSSILTVLLLILLNSCNKNSDNKSNFYSKKICKEKVAPFYYNNKSSQSENELLLLCSCLWQKFPEGSWQRKLNIKLHKGEDIGWKIKSFSTIFENNYKICLKELNIDE